MIIVSSYLYQNMDPFRPIGLFQPVSTHEWHLDFGGFRPTLYKTSPMWSLRWQPMLPIVGINCLGLATLIWAMKKCGKQLDPICHKTRLVWRRYHRSQASIQQGQPIDTTSKYKAFSSCQWTINLHKSSHIGVPSIWNQSFYTRKSILKQLRSYGNSLPTSKLTSSVRVE